ncbi:MAG TPA: HlyD family efflux transporter periplasmic adaptor subunit [Planctomycetota bacterium]|nr:HlyD family efflux transporter periplasmic adaptor subunit [Planctomycetota bacterium]
MTRNLLFPLVAVLGLGFAIYTITTGSRPVPVGEAVSDPAVPPFESYVAGAGVVEAASRNVAIGSPLARLVLEVPVKVGSAVKAGDPLFHLDDRDLKAELATRQATLELEKERLDRLVALPRPEDVPSLEARVVEAEAVLADLRNQVALRESVSDPRSVSLEELTIKRFAAHAAEAKLADARAQLALIKAGAWKKDIEVASGEIKVADRQVQALDTEIERLTVRAPFDGTVLQLNVRPGEFAPSGTLETPLIVFGSIQPFHVRVDIDENDAWRFRPEAAAVASIRGNPELKTSLTFEYVEPLVLPKRSLTGDPTERVDTRVLQVVYSFKRKEFPIYAGQQMDVFIEAPSRSLHSSPPGKAALLRKEVDAFKEDGQR